MTTIAPQPSTATQRKIHSLKIDMTPMVDLGFLLITFFVFTATLSQPSVTKLVMPASGGETPVPQSKTLTLLLDRDKAFAYESFWQDAVAHQKIRQTGYDLQTGIGNSIRQKQKSLSSKDEVIVLIKPLATASYQRIIAALDEMQINGVKKYAFVDATAEEENFAKNR